MNTVLFSLVFDSKKPFCKLKIFLDIHEVIQIEICVFLIRGISISYCYSWNVINEKFVFNKIKKNSFFYRINKYIIVYICEARD